VPNPFNGYITNPNSALLVRQFKRINCSCLIRNSPLSGETRGPLQLGFQLFQARVEERLPSGLDLLVTYTFSKALDDASSSDNTFLGGATSLQDPNKPYLERSVSLFDIPQQFQFTHVYPLPFGRGREFWR